MARWDAFGERYIRPRGTTVTLNDNRLNTKLDIPRNKAMLHKCTNQR